MAMTEVFDKLKALQDVLAEKYSLMAKIEDSPKQLFTQDELLVRLRKEFLETSAVYEKVKAEASQLQLELEEAEKSREAGEKGIKMSVFPQKPAGLDIFHRILYNVL